MPDATLDDLARRIDGLERQNRTLWRVCGGGALILLSVVQLGQAAPKVEAVPEVLKARKFEVVDEKGVRRVSLGSVDTGESPGFGLELQDGEGRGAATFGCRDDGSQVLWLHDPKARALVRFELAVSGGVVHMAALDGDQRSRVRLRVRDNGASEVSMLAEDGSVVAELTNRKK
jgi:hypothetical protein